MTLWKTVHQQEFDRCLKKNNCHLLHAASDLVLTLIRHWYLRYFYQQSFLLKTCILNSGCAKSAFQYQYNFITKEVLP